MNGGAKKWAMEGRAGLKTEREDKGVKRESKGGVHMVEEGECLLMAALVYVGSQLFCVRKQPKKVGVGIHGCRYL